MASIILLTGPSGSGKTTIAKQFLEKQSDTWAYVNQDDIRQLVKSGYATADGLRTEWTEHTEKQWKASIPLCLDIAKRYSEFGISCIIDFYSTYNEYCSDWKKYLEKTDYNLIILMPNKETVIQRNEAREYPLKLSDLKIEECFEDFQDWPKHIRGVVIDNSDMAIEEVLNEIETTIQ